MTFPAWPIKFAIAQVLATQSFEIPESELPRKPLFKHG